MLELCVECWSCVWNVEEEEMKRLCADSMVSACAMLKLCLDCWSCVWNIGAACGMLELCEWNVEDVSGMLKLCVKC